MSDQFDQLHNTVRTLLGEKGCPWDKRQTNISLKKHFESELDELLTAIDRGDVSNICEELGDLLYLIILLSEINKKNGDFTINDVISGINAKLIRRHPHVFDRYVELSEDELRNQWTDIKAKEKVSK